MHAVIGSGWRRDVPHSGRAAYNHDVEVGAIIHTLSSPITVIGSGESGGSLKALQNVYLL